MLAFSQGRHGRVARAKGQWWLAAGERAVALAKKKKKRGIINLQSSLLIKPSRLYLN